MGIKWLCFNLLILSSIFIICTCGDDEAECIYGIYVQTGSVARAGTHSKISLTLSTTSGDQLEIPNLEDWGLMGPGFNYFEKGELNIFGGKGPCLTGAMCFLNLTSDGSGPYAGWYCDYVQVSVSGLKKDCFRQHFTVDQWLALDEEPYELSTFRNGCLRERAGPSLRLSMATST